MRVRVRVRVALVAHLDGASAVAAVAGRSVVVVAPLEPPRRQRDAVAAERRARVEPADAAAAVQLG